MKKLIPIFLTLIVSVSSLSGDTLRFQFGLWPGDLEPELEPRFLLDDLIEGGGFGRINLPWANKTTMTFYPLGIQYFTKSGKNEFVFTANLIGYTPEYRFNGISISPLAVSIVSLQDYVNGGIEFDAGIKFPVDVLQITPKLGIRRHTQSFLYNELTIGQYLALSLGNNQFEADATGLYLGLDLEIKLENNLSLVTEYLNSSFLPGFKGSMKFQKTVIYLGGGSFALGIENQSSSYEVSIERFKLGLDLALAKNFSLEFGFRTETQEHTYPGYVNLPLFVTNAGIFPFFTVLEIITDFVFWQQTQKQEKGLLYVAAKINTNI